ncbi:MAG: methionyl-tRNA formyltransferase [Actinobacteria bacterium]|nr:methionyl-tRNA formyltransferase [Actinomycetota bacterium]
MRVCFFGTPEAAVPSLRAFLEDPRFEVVAVVTNPDRPRGRGHALRAPPVKVVAAKAALRVWQPERPGAVGDRLRALRVDACAVVAYGALLPPALLAAGGRGFVNLHFSLLPSWRGAAPVTHTILAGQRHTGVTCFLLDAGMDTGPVLLTTRTEVAPGETAGELTARLAALGARPLVGAVAGLVDGTLRPRIQDHARATYAPKVTPADARLDWTRDAVSLERRVRAYNPAPGAHTTYRGRRLKVHRAAVAGPADPGGHVEGTERGTVVAVGDRGPVVACGRGALVLTQVQPAGRPRMDGVAFANGYRPHGRRLGR